MKEEFNELLECNNHSNQQLIALISKHLNIVSKKTFTLINYLVKAHQIWNARITGEVEFKVWQINNSDDLLDIDNENYVKTLEPISSRHLGNIIEYSNLN